MRISSRLFLVTFILMAVGVGLFVWGMNTDLQPAQGLQAGEPMRQIGQVAGMIIGVALVPLVAGFVLRLRSR